MVGVATNTDPDSKFAYAARGDQWITVSETGVEAATQEEFDAYVKRLLIVSMNPVATLSVSHALIPVNPYDLVTFSPSTGQTRSATVQAMRIRTGFDAQVQATWQEVQVFDG